MQNLFNSNDFDDFLINSKSWTAAAQETFLTWGLLGASVISMSSRTSFRSSSKTALRRDALLVVFLTLIGLFMAALLGLSSQQILSKHFYAYVPGSYGKFEMK